MAGRREERPLKIWGQVTLEQLEALDEGVRALNEAMPRVADTIEEFMKLPADDPRRTSGSSSTGERAPSKTTKPK